MKKAIIGVAVAAVLGVGGYFGYGFAFERGYNAGGCDVVAMFTGMPVPMCLEAVSK